MPQVPQNLLVASQNLGHGLRKPLLSFEFLTENHQLNHFAPPLNSASHFPVHSMAGLGTCVGSGGTRKITPRQLMAT